MNYMCLMIKFHFIQLNMTLLIFHYASVCFQMTFYHIFFHKRDQKLNFC